MERLGCLGSDSGHVGELSAPLKNPLAVSCNLEYGIVVTRSQIESAIQGGVPFTLRMADGREYEIPHRDYISLSPKGTFVTVYDDKEHYFVLPLLTMTGLVSKTPSGNAGSKKK